MGLKITTDDRPVTVFRKDREWNGTTFPTYSLGVSSKDKDGNWVNGFLDAEFKRGTDIPNKSQIAITDAFPKVTEYQGKKYVKFFVLDYTIIKQGEEPQPQPQTIDNSWVTIPEGFNEDDMPFK